MEKDDKADFFKRLRRKKQKIRVWFELYNKLIAPSWTTDFDKGEHIHD